MDTLQLAHWVEYSTPDTVGWAYWELSIQLWILLGELVELNIQLWTLSGELNASWVFIYGHSNQPVELNIQLWTLLHEFMESWVFSYGYSWVSSQSWTFVFGHCQVRPLRVEYSYMDTLWWAHRVENSTLDTVGCSAAEVQFSLVLWQFLWTLNWTQVQVWP